jgi:hypothetical protein
MARILDRASWGTWTIVATLAIANIVWISLCSKVVDGDAAKPQPHGLAANLRFQTTTAQLGQVRSSLPLTCEFSFVNAGKDAIELVEARPGCGCLKPHLERRKFGPGQRGVVAMEVQTLGQAAGPHTWHLTLIYKDGTQVREQALQVTATVVTEVSVQPAALTMFTEGDVIQEVTVTDLRPTPLEIVAVESTSPQVTTDAGPFAKDDCGNFTSKIKIQSTGELSPGRHDEYVVIRTSDPVYSEFKVPVTIVKEAAKRISATPAQLTLHASALVRLRDVHDQPVVVECVTSDHPGVICQWAPGPDHQATIKLKLQDSKHTGGPAATTVRVHVQSPVREVVTIAVRWVDE